jgi:predicted anti-sigma-YlaC factor YlaD
MGCPDLEMMERYIRGESGTADVAVMESHLAECQECRDRVAQMREDEKLLEALRTVGKNAGRGPDDKSIVDTIEKAQSLLGERYRVIRVRRGRCTRRRMRCWSGLWR